MTPPDTGPRPDDAPAGGSGGTPPDVEALLASARAGRGERWRAMAAVGVRMMLHDKLRLAGVVFGVVFAVVLSVQQLGVLLGLLQKNTMFVDNAGADVWITPPGTEFLQPGPLLDESALMTARAAPGVTLAAPLVLTNAAVRTPEGGSEPITLVGTALPAMLGGPWNVVSGDPAALADPDAMFFEDSRREQLGSLDPGSRREVNGRRITAVGFTWGLLPFGPSYAFAEIDLARELAGVPDDQMSFVLVVVRPPADPETVARELQARLPSTTVMTSERYRATIVGALLREQLGISFGTSTAFGLIVGFVIVALTMFSSVLDNLRQFGTLKAIGCTTRDLAVLLLVQSVGYALLGSLIGLGVAAQIAALIRSPQLVVVIPPALIAAVPVVMTLLCLAAATLALARIRKLEPGVVFR